ncbi:MAG: RNA-binding protein [Myxococcales bacterium]|nr:RNA-binding protein [Myxococcales bacterium]
MLSIDEVVNNIYAQPDEDGGRAHAIPCRLFIGGLNWRVTTDELQEMLEEYGPVADAFIVTDRDTGDSRGFGFVTMRDRRDASQAIRRLNGQDFHGRTLVVRLATERQR